MKSLLSGFSSLAKTHEAPQCGSCGRFRKCNSPKMEGTEGTFNVAIVISSPNSKEDQEGEARIRDRKHVVKAFNSIGIRINEASVLFAAACHSSGPTDSSHVSYCQPLFRERLEHIDPEVIICLGPQATEAVVSSEWHSGIGLFERWAGAQIPLDGRWVCPTYSTFDIACAKNDVVEKDAKKHIASALNLVGSPPEPRRDYEKEVEILTTKGSIIEAIRDFYDRGEVVAVDYETNCLKPDWHQAKAVSMAIADSKRCVSFCLENPTVNKLLGQFLKSAKNPKVAANLKMEERWTRMIYGHGVSNWVWDTMLAAHCIDNSPGATGLKFQAFIQFGVGTYNSEIEPYLKSGKTEHYNRIDDADRETLLLYGGMDAILELDLYKKQLENELWNVETRQGEPMLEGLNLLIQGVVTLAEIEANGIGIDTKNLAATRSEIEKRIRRLKREIREDDLWDVWRKRYKQSANIRSRDQLKWLVYEHLGFPVTLLTDKGQPSTNAEALSMVDHPFVKKISDMMRFDKANGTFLHGIEAETVDDRLHAVFNLHIARTFRSSSDSPNFQNFPVRDKEISEIIRTQFVPRDDDHMILECDFKGIEVSMSHCYHKDPQFRRDITEPGRDMHRDMAAEVYCVNRDQVSKDMRYGAKNKFVFPQFYGDYYVSCTKALWDWMIKADLQTTDGHSVRDCLAARGIHERGDCDHDVDAVQGTFEYHVQQVEKRFWNERYQRYGKWRKEWYDAYLERGYLDLLTGFRIQGNMRRNAVVNYPVQGSAFHCLLWSLTKVQKLLKKNNMESQLIGQIHDSMIAEVPVRELRNFLQIVETVTSIGLAGKYKWLTVPMVIEFEACPPGRPWYEKKEFHFQDGKFIVNENPTSNVDKFLETL